MGIESNRWTAAESAGSSWWWWLADPRSAEFRFAAGLLLLVLTAAVYLPTLGGGFIWDDDRYVADNPTLRSAAGLGQIWFEIGATPQYYPLVHTTFWFEYQLWGADPVGYHAVNVLLHGLAAVLLWRVLRRLDLPGAWIAAALFALHPVHVESVAWITERKNVLSGVFYFGSALAFLRAALDAPDRPGRAKSAALYVLSFLLFVGALLSKTVAASLPAALLLVLWWKHGRTRWAEWRLLLPWFAVGIPFGLLTAWMEKHRVGAIGDEWTLSLVERCLVAGRALWFYAGKLVWPHPLVFVYPRWEIDAAEWVPYLYPTAAVAVLATLWLLRRRLGRGPLVALLFFAGSLVPALGFFDVFPHRYSFVADHFQYLASVGGIVLLVETVRRVLVHRGRPGTLLARGLATAVLVVFAALTVLQGRTYANLETLWSATLERNPGAWIAHNNLGIVLRAQGRVEEAERHYLEAQRLNPDDPQIYYNLGNLLAAEGETSRAVRQYREALRLRPVYPLARSNLGSALQMQGKLEEAIRHYRLALRDMPGSLETHFNLASVLQLTGRFEEAVPHYRFVLLFRPDSPRLHHNLALALQSLGRPEEALPHHRRVAELQPDSPDAFYLWGTACAATGRTEEALEHLRRASELRPNWPVALNATAWVLATRPDGTVADGEEAIRLARLAAELTDHQDPSVLDTLAAGYAAAGRFELAVATARDAVAQARDSGADDLAERAGRRLELYRSGKSHRESVEPRPS